MESKPELDMTREQKRAQFSGGEQPRNRSITILAAVLVGLVTVAAILVWSSVSDKPASAVSSQSPADPREQEIRIPLSELSEGNAKFFDYKLAGNQTARFFVIRSSDGVYRAALDACDVCFRAKMGYRQQGDHMICNKCGLKFESTMINEVSGGCNPVGLPRAIEGEQLVIKASELERRSNYF